MCASSQQHLRAAADAVAADLGLDAALREIGAPTLVGSAALGVIVAQDIDITVAVPALPAAQPAITELGLALLQHPRVRQVTLRNDTGDRKVSSRYPDGWYLGIHYGAGEDAWTLDLWFVDEPDRQPDLAHLRELAPRITDEARQTILELKRAVLPQDRPARMPSYDIYRAVLDHGVTTVDELSRWQASGSTSQTTE